MAIVLFILVALQFTHIMDFMIIMPLGDEFMRLFGISPREFSLLVSSYTFTAGTASFTGAFFIDRFDRKKALIFVNIGFVFGTFLCGIADSYIYLLIARIITGFFGGLINGLLFTIVGDAFPVEKRSGAMGIITSAFSIAAVIGVPSGLYLANLYGWQFPFQVMAGLGFIVLLLIFKFIPNMNSHLISGNSRKSPLELLKIFLIKRNQQLALVFMMLLVLGQFMVIPFITPYMIRNVGFTQDQIPLIYFVGGGLTFFTGPLIGKMADKFGRKNVFLVMAILSLIPLYLITNLTPIPLYLALAISGLFFVCISGRMIPSNSLMTSVVLPENRGGFMSLSSSFQQIGAGIASLIAGILVYSANDGTLINYNYVGYIGIITTLIAIYISFKLTTLEGK